LPNKYNENEWNAYFEGKIEVFALQLSLVMSNMTYTPREISHGNAILWTSNRLQYASNPTKLSISVQLFDRGLLNRNGVMDIWSLPHVPGGELYYIRKEYAKLEDLGKEFELSGDGEETEPPPDGATTDDGTTPDAGTGGAHNEIGTEQ